ncbi:hypothetical protein ACFQY5_14395 [Paeniroseomonas aquatica]|uniref:hypothetical protein n=1 Tax=Paeniroseomonas aquatica TaxID=373043 RepID=UPI00361217DA
MLVLTGATPAGLEEMVQALGDAEQQPRIQGDLALLSGGRIQAFTLGDSYTTGSLPPWLWPQLYLSSSPAALLGTLALAVILLAAPLYWTLRRRAVQRLRVRTQ